MKRKSSRIFSKEYSLMSSFARDVLTTVKEKNHSLQCKFKSKTSILLKKA